MPVEPFVVKVDQSVLDDLHMRLDRTRWTCDRGDSGWSYGASVPYMQQLVAYWRDRFDWRGQEAALNRFASFRATLNDGLRIHFIHERGRGPEPLPIVLTHGFPDSIVRFTKIIPMLTDPASHGADPADSFDVVAPSLPGYAFSDRPRSDGGVFRVGDLWHELMTQLGYDLCRARRRRGKHNHRATGARSWRPRRRHSPDRCPVPPFVQETRRSVARRAEVSRFSREVSAR